MLTRFSFALEWEAKFYLAVAKRYYVESIMRNEHNPKVVRTLWELFAANYWILESSS